MSRRSSTRTLGSMNRSAGASRCQPVARLECSGCKQAGMATTPNGGIARQHRCKQACPCHSMQTLGRGSVPTEVLVSSEGGTQRQQLQAFVSLLPCGDIGRGRYRCSQAATWQPWQRARMLTAMPVPLCGHSSTGEVSRQVYLFAHNRHMDGFVPITTWQS